MREIKRYVVAEPGGSKTIALTGRFSQTLDALIAAGDRGITALDIAHWAVRLSHYIYILRKKHGLTIEMLEEEHGGEFPGRHGRYTLKTPCQPNLGEWAA